MVDKYLDETQYGYREATRDAIAMLRMLGELRINQHKYLYAAIID